MRQARACITGALGLAVLPIFASASGLAGESPSASAAKTTATAVSLVPVTIPGINAVPQNVQRLSNGTWVIVIREVRDLNTGLLVLVSPDGTRRAILTNGPVNTVRCVGRKIYTWESLWSPTPNEMRALARWPNAGEVNPELRKKITGEIREYDPMDGTSRTFRKLTPSLRRYGFWVERNNLYLPEVGWNEATKAYEIHVTAVSLSDSQETTKVISTAAGDQPGMTLRDGWVYYANLSGVSRASLATGERQAIVRGDRARSFCLMENPKALVYVKHAGPRSSVLRIVPLDGSPPGQLELPANAAYLKLWYDESADEVILRALEGDPEDEDTTSVEKLYRVAITR